MDVNDIRWIHQIALPDGTVTPGVSRPAIDDFGLAEIDVRGRRVLDVGCLDGLYSFYAEQRGAVEVVSIDILEEQFGRPNERYNTGAGYLWAHERLGSRARYIFPFSVYDIAELGQFDVVYCIGVLYHVAHPLLVLERINGVLRTGGMLVLESEVSATHSLFSHHPCHTKTFSTVHRVSASQAPGRFLKIAFRNPRRALRLLPFVARRLRDSLGLSDSRDAYAADPSVLVVPDITTLERMIDFSGFAIEKAFARAARMAYHCRKVVDFDPVFAENSKSRTADRITNLS